MFFLFLSGILTALAFPTSIDGFRLPDLGILAWISLVPLYLYLREVSPTRAFQATFLFGTTFYGICFYWFFIAMHHYGEIPVWGSLLGLLVVVVIITSFAALATSLSVWMSSKGNLPLALTFPLAWIAQDYARNFIVVGGFPWSSLAYSQRSFLTLLQILDLTGIQGLTFLILLSNVLVGELVCWLRKRRGFPAVPAVLFLALFTLSLANGRIRLGQVRKDLSSRERLRVAMIQGNIPQEQKWMEEKIEEIIARHIVLTEEANKEHPDLIVWPEAAYPAVMPPDLIQVDLLKELQKPLLMGVVTYEGTIPDLWPPKPDDSSFAMFNSAVLIEPRGYIAGQYNKVHLVPMGEYIPLKPLFFFMDKISPSFSSFTPGKEFNLLGEGKRKFGVTICYEDLFPEISRTFVRKGADFLVNLTNDAWYDRSSAVFQHFDFSRFRAIENRRAMVRATNTGVSGFFSPTGEVIASAPVFEEAYVVANIPLGGPKSFYTRLGDLFTWGCVIVLGLILGKQILEGPWTANLKNASKN